MRDAQLIVLGILLGWILPVLGWFIVLVIRYGFRTHVHITFTTTITKIDEE